MKFREQNSYSSLRSQRNSGVWVTVHTPLSREVFWHEYAKIPRHTSQNSIAAGNLEWILATLLWTEWTVESINRELDNTEKEHCQKVTMKILMGVIAFAICCTVGLIQDMLSLISLTTFIILISQYVGILKYKIENSKNKRRW